jgi:hypothetical protein
VYAIKTYQAIEDRKMTFYTCRFTYEESSLIIIEQSIIGNAGSYAILLAKCSPALALGLTTMAWTALSSATTCELDSECTTLNGVD